MPASNILKQPNFQLQETRKAEDKFHNIKKRNN